MHSTATGPPDCGILPSPDNGVVVFIFESTLVGAIAEYRCSSGFNLVGFGARFCQANGTWSDFEPTCEGKDIYDIERSVLLHRVTTYQNKQESFIHKAIAKSPHYEWPVNKFLYKLQQSELK